jgi:hypothetical protein
MAQFQPQASADDGTRTAFSYTNNGIYVSVGTVTGDTHGCIRFPGVTVDQGASIATATLTVEVTTVTGTKPASVVRAENVDDSGQVTSDTDFDSRMSNRTTAGTTLNPVSTGQKVVQVTNIVQEIVNRGGWASGQAIQFLIDGSTSPSGWGYTLFAYDNGSNIPVLDIAVGGVSGEPAMIALTGRGGL